MELKLHSGLGSSQSLEQKYFEFSSLATSGGLPRF